MLSKVKSTSYIIPKKLVNNNRNSIDGSQLTKASINTGRLSISMAKLPTDANSSMSKRISISAQSAREKPAAIVKIISARGNDRREPHIKNPFAWQ